MTDRSADPLTPLHLRLRLRLAAAALWWERAWPACWPALFVLAVFLIVALFGVFPLLPGLVHGALLLGFGAAFLLLLSGALRGGIGSETSDARRRIERASGLRHRPLQALADRPSAPLDPLAAQLWEAHRRRMALAVRRLRVGWPAAGLAARDPLGLRAGLAILLLLGAVDAGSDWRDRLLRAVNPDLESGAPGLAASLDIWVTPPEYTGLPPQFLRPQDRQTIRIPTGSKLLAQVHGGDGAPHLAIDRLDRSFATVDAQDFRAETVLKTGRRITVSQGGDVLGSWAIEIIPDNPPSVAFARPPAATVRQAVRLDYRAGDDYGVEKVAALIRLQSPPGAQAGRGKPEPKRSGKTGAEIALDLPLPGLHLKQAQATSYHDLTPSPWAGLPVEIRLVATDALGQTGESQPVRMTLPERVFHNPVARAIIEQRRELAIDPGARDEVAGILGDLHAHPQLYGDDAMAFLGLRVAAERLRLQHDAGSLGQVQQLLWDLALRIEDGHDALAQTELRRIERALQDALARNAPDREIDRLTHELKQALDRYLQSLAQNFARHPDQGEPPPNGAQMLSRRDLDAMLDRARELAMNGARAQARELLAQLQSMLENMRIARPGQQQQQNENEAQQMMRDMRQLMQRQQQLLDRSFRAEQQAEQGRMGLPGEEPDQQPGQSTNMGDAALQQEGLRRSLGDMMRRMGEGLGSIPEPLGRAEREMRQAGEALRARQPGDAIGPQTAALDQLQQAARQFAQQMQRRLGSAWGQPADGEPGGRGDRIERDPLGRPMATEGAYDTGDVKLPDKSTLQKTREILDELRRRAGERDRPEIEHEYIDRLLQRF